MKPTPLGPIETARDACISAAPRISAARAAKTKCVEAAKTKCVVGRFSRTM